MEAAKKPESEPMESDVEPEPEKPAQSAAEPMNDESGLLDWGRMDSDKAKEGWAMPASQDAAGPRLHKKRSEMTPEEEGRP